jgi:hypothetical protein
MKQYNRFFGFWVMAAVIGGLHLLAVGHLAAQGTAFDPNGVQAHAERSAHLLGSYLSVIADPHADQEVVSRYQRLAQELFTADAVVEISSLNRKTKTVLSAQAYIKQHYEDLRAAKGYDSIMLQWEVTESVGSADGMAAASRVKQSFVAKRGAQIAYQDFTIKDVMIVFESHAVPVPGANSVKLLKIKSIKVVSTSSNGKDLPSGSPRKINGA